ncbi:MAG TPA: hypothetical protein VJZ78_06845 [Anaerolineales bacterium]|nr:hypothetical protein [Anaerolineales bacterium]
MINCKTGFIFPPEVIPALATLRGYHWTSLVEQILSEPDQSIETIAFTHMMVKINNCQTCNSDSFRAMNGCQKCSTQSISRFRGTDPDLIDLFNSSKYEVETFLRKRES